MKPEILILVDPTDMRLGSQTLHMCPVMARQATLFVEKTCDSLATIT